jgi:hypothetical protein
MPPIVLTIVGFINLALTYAPEVQSIYVEARKLIKMLFQGGLITAAQQIDLMAWANLHQAATLAGQRPPELVVDPPTP